MKAKSMFIFALGAALGAVGGYFYAKKKFKTEPDPIQIKYDPDDEVLIDDIVDDPNKVIAKKGSYNPHVDMNAPTFRDYANRIRPYQSAAISKDKGGAKMRERPYPISPAEFGELDYEMVDLDYFAGDNILADDWGYVIEDVEGMVGEDFVKEFGKYVDDPDTVYIRNDAHKCDFEISRDNRSWNEVYKENDEGVPVFKERKG